jgi:hypothetical protein
MRRRQLRHAVVVPAVGQWRTTWVLVLRAPSGRRGAMEVRPWPRRGAVVVRVGRINGDGGNCAEVPARRSRLLHLGDATLVSCVRRQR